MALCSGDGYQSTHRAEARTDQPSAAIKIVLANGQPVSSAMMVAALHRVRMLCASATEGLSMRTSLQIHMLPVSNRVPFQTRERVAEREHQLAVHVAAAGGDYDA